MIIACPILLAAATLTGANSLEMTQPRVAVPSVRQMTLSDAMAAAARREPLSLDQRAAGAPRPIGRNYRRGPARPSNMTRATAIVAGAVMGSLAGMVGGAMVDLATSNGECLTGMRVGLPVGAILGGVITARFVR